MQAQVDKPIESKTSKGATFGEQRGNRMQQQVQECARNNKEPKPCDASHEDTDDQQVEPRRRMARGKDNEPSARQ